MIKTTSHQTGLIAEFIARLYLRIIGHKIIASRLKTPTGEIDILTKHKNTWIIIEVKYRKQKTDAMTCISHNQQRRLINASMWICKHYNLNMDTPFRFDAIIMWNRFNIKHIKNAWQNSDL